MVVWLTIAAALMGLVLIDRPSYSLCSLNYSTDATTTTPLFTTVITIDPLRGKDTPDCLTGKEVCHSLAWAFSHRSSSTKYFLEKGIHILNTSTETFAGSLNTLSFEGNANSSNEVVIHCTAENTGLAFEGVKGLTFSYLTFYNCSSLRNSTTRDYRNYSSSDKTKKFYDFQVSLYFYQCSDVTMLFVNVSDSPNATGVIMYDTNGTNLISDSLFQNNIIALNTTSTHSPNGGGGGFYVEFTYCKPGDTNCNNTHSIEETITGAAYTFLRCQFLNNQAHDSSSDKGTYLVEFESDHVAFGRGGGLSIFVKDNSYNNNFAITNCTFSGNKATWGGGMLMEFQDYAANNSLHIQHSSFLNNMAFYTPTSGTGGGGLRIGHCVYHQPKRDVPGNRILIEASYFTNNQALNGGGVSISVSRQNTSTDHLAQININDCIFYRNTARLGAGLHVDGFALILVGLKANVNLAGCSFDHNSIEYLKPLEVEKSLPFQAGLGAVYVHEIDLAFLGNILFAYNIGTGLAGVHTRLSFFDCNARFIHNTGHKGGGLALLGGSTLMINDATRMNFTGNLAMVHGGAIHNTYISRENMDSYAHCFIRHIDPYKYPDDWGASFYFQDNIHMCGSHPNSIFTTSILPCAWAGGVGVNANLSEIFCWTNWSYFDSNKNPVDCASQLGTDTGNISFTTTGNNTNHVQAFPGHKFELKIEITDDLGHDISEQTMFIAVTNTSDSFLGDNGNLYSYVWGESATVWGEEMNDIELSLDSVEDRVWHLDIVIDLLSCPPGFKQMNLTNTVEGECVCSEDYGGVLLCDNKNFHAMLKNSNWMGLLPPDDDTYLSSSCPPGYCHSEDKFSHFDLQNDSTLLEEKICGTNNRKGILCGKCVEGFEPAVNSPTYKCVNCTDVKVVRNIFKYVSIVYLPIIFMFIIIILFGVRLTSAPANAFILYSQIISSTFNLDADGQIPLVLITGTHTNALLKAYRIPYGIFNLELIENLISPFCIGTGLDTLAVISLEYAVAFAPLLMIIVAILIMRLASLIGDRFQNSSSMERSKIFTASAAFIAKRKRTLSESLLPAFAAFLLLSYTKFSLTSAYILNQQYLVDEHGKLVSPARVYYSGHFTMHDRQYVIQYFIPAVIFFVVFAIVPPLILLHYPMRVFEWCLEKVPCLWRIYPSTKVHVLLDTFQGSFKIKYRFFAGLYFVFRLVINFNIMLNESWLQQYIVQQAACVIMVMLIAVCQPYNQENNFFNQVDAFIFTNLAVINAISLYLYVYAQNNPEVQALPSFAFFFQYILVYLPLIYILLYIIWERTSPYHKAWKRAAKIKTLIILNRWKIKRYKFIDSAEETETVFPSHSSTTPLMYQPNINEGLEESEDVILRRAEMENTYRPRNRLVTIVEAHGREGEASLRHTTTSEDSGLRSVQSSPAYYYGSTGERNSGQSTSSRSSLRNSGHRQESDGEGESRQSRHSSKSYGAARNSYDNKGDNRRQTS